MSVIKDIVVVHLLQLRSLEFVILAVLTAFAQLQLLFPKMDNTIRSLVHFGPSMKNKSVTGQKWQKWREQQATARDLQEVEHQDIL